MFRVKETDVFIDKKMQVECFQICKTRMPKMLVPELSLESELTDNETFLRDLEPNGNPHRRDSRGPVAPQLFQSFSLKSGPGIHNEKEKRLQYN